LHLDAYGSRLHTFEYSFTEPKINHVTHSPDIPDAIMVWFFLDGGSRTRISRASLATGVPQVLVETDLFLSGVNRKLGSDTLFGPAHSCTIALIGYPGQIRAAATREDSSTRTATGFSSRYRVSLAATTLDLAGRRRGSAMAITSRGQPVRA